MTNNFPDFIKIITLDHCDSTNNYLKNNYENLKESMPVLATTTLQTAGRGRDKRIWISPRGKGLYTSLGFFLETPKNLNLLPLISGISVIETLKEITGIEFGLKWPNDIHYEHKKLSGILIENVIMETKVFCISGIGINLNHSTIDFPPELTNKATSLKMISGNSYNITQINQLLSIFFFQWLEKLKKGYVKEIIYFANKYSLFLKNKSICFHNRGNNKIIEGIYKGINHDGGLILETHWGNTAIYYSGEII